MHNIHFILIRADSAVEAASEAENQILDWGNENNWRCVGGIAAEDGSDDIENHNDGRWGLSFLDEKDRAPKGATYFSRALAYVRDSFMEPLAHLPATLLEVSEKLWAFDPLAGNGFALWCIGRDLQDLSDLFMSRAASERGVEIPELREWQFDQFGLTDMTEQSEGSRRYLVFVDMHS